MMRTESLDHLNKPYLDPNDQNKKRSNRSRSKPKSGVYRAGRKSPSTVKLLSFDPSFERFDIPKHEGEVKSYRQSKTTDFQGIVSEAYDNETPTMDSERTSQNPMLYVLKAPNIPSSMSVSPFDQDSDHYDHICTCDDNYDDDYATTPIESDAGTVLHIPISPRIAPRKEIAPQTTDHNANIRPEVKSTNADHTNLWNSQSITVEPPTQLSISSPFSLEELDEWMSVFTRTYKEEVITIKNADMDEGQELQQINALYELWIENLYEQLYRLSDTYQDFETSTKEDRDEFDKEITGLQKLYYESRLEISHELGKVATLEKENTRNIKTIENLQNSISTLKQAKEEKFQEASQRLNLQLDDNTDVQEQRDKVKGALEELKAKIYLKQRRLQKLNVEEHSMKLRIRNLEKEEYILKSKLNELRETGKIMLGMQTQPSTATQGRYDTGDDKALDECWRNLSSGADP